MAINLALESSTPARAQYELDRLTLHYRSDQPWNVTVVDLSVPQKGDAHPDFRFLFVSDIQLTESGDRQCAFDVIYQGAFLETGGDTSEPVLPPRPHEDDNAIMSATSKVNRSGQILTSGITVQFYAPTTQLTWFTHNAKGVSGTAPDPPVVSEIIKVEIGDTTFAITSTNIADLVAAFFVPLTVKSLRNTEVVAGGKYWKNSEKRTSTLSPWIYTLPSGDFIALSNGGTGYFIGNVLTINDGPLGHSATIRVDSLGLSGSILTFTQLSNTFDYSTFILPGFGGSGEGAAFYNIHIP